MADARFEDIGGGPINVGAQDEEDLKVISALCQDAVIKSSDVSFRAKHRQMNLLLQRFRWEEGSGHGPERVQSILQINQVEGIRSKGIKQGDNEQTLSLLSLAFMPDPLPSGVLELQFSGQAALRFEIEAIELHLRDVTRPYQAVSGKTPQHLFDDNEAE